MQKTNIYNENNREYVSLSDMYIGHLITGGLVAFGVGIIYWLSSFFFTELRADFEKILVFLFLTVIVAELLICLLQRPLVVRAQRASPGGFLYALYEVLVTPLVAFIFASILFGKFFIAGFWFALFGCAVVFLTLVTKPWQRGLSREEFREKYEATREFMWKEARKEHAKNHRDL
ncbi:MAG: hypothetical protein SOR40_09540 [Rothia sp. (in: high G+C Gram-positive bacteria)]|nr:hypothetical protein [Rothia sp. (in: high G+C Gram-positive bacteria)]